MSEKRREEDYELPTARPWQTKGSIPRSKLCTVHGFVAFKWRMHSLLPPAVTAEHVVVAMASETPVKHHNEEYLGVTKVSHELMQDFRDETNPLYSSYLPVKARTNAPLTR